MVNYNKLYYFYIITLRGSMNQAAQQLYISQPALSKSVKDLEAFFGVSLFDREKRNLMLTPAGETLRRECVRIFSGEEHLLHQMRQFQDDTQKTLRFGYMIYKEIGSIIFFVGLTLPRYRFSKPSASLDMNLR